MFVSKSFMVCVVLITHNLFLGEVKGQTECREEFTEPYGTFNSTNFPLNYTLNTKCEYLFTAPEGYRVHITLAQHFSLEPDHREDCSYDYLVFHDGANDESDVIQKLCDYHPEPLEITSTTNILYAKFYSDDRFVYPGFVGLYDMIPNRKLELVGSYEDRKMEN